MRREIIKFPDKVSDTKFKQLTSMIRAANECLAQDCGINRIGDSVVVDHCPYNGMVTADLVLRFCWDNTLKPTFETHVDGKVFKHGKKHGN